MNINKNLVIIFVCLCVAAWFLGTELGTQARETLPGVVELPENTIDAPAPVASHLELGE